MDSTTLPPSVDDLEQTTLPLPIYTSGEGTDDSLAALHLPPSVLGMLRPESNLPPHLHPNSHPHSPLDAHSHLQPHSQSLSPNITSLPEALAHSSSYLPSTSATVAPLTLHPSYQAVTVASTVEGHPYHTITNFLTPEDTMAAYPTLLDFTMQSQQDGMNLQSETSTMLSQGIPIQSENGPGPQGTIAPSVIGPNFHDIPASFSSQSSHLGGPNSVPNLYSTDIEMLPNFQPSSATKEDPDETVIPSFGSRALPDSPFLVTLPFSAGQRPLYLQKAAQSEAINETYLQTYYHHHESLKPSLVHNVEHGLLELLDICDYPASLEEHTLQKLSTSQRQKLAIESNAKYTFLWHLLTRLIHEDVKILILARSTKIISFLESLLSPQGIAYSTVDLVDLSSKLPDHQSLRVVLSLVDNPHRNALADFDVVIGFDFRFRTSEIANQIASLYATPLPNLYGNHLPITISLALSYSVEHIDQVLEPLPELVDRKAAIARCLSRSLPFLKNTETQDKPEGIAAMFTEYICRQDNSFVWDPEVFPPDFFDRLNPMEDDMPEERDDSEAVKAESASASGDSRPTEVLPVHSKKRKLSDADSTHTTNDAYLKRVKSSALSREQLLDPDRHNAVAPILDILGDKHLDIVYDEARPDEEEIVKIPRALLQSLIRKLGDSQRHLIEEQERVAHAETALQICRTEIESQLKTVNGIVQRHREATIERGQFELRCKDAETQRDKLVIRVQELESQVASRKANEKTELEASVSSHTDATNDTHTTDSALGQNQERDSSDDLALEQQARREAEDQVESLRKKISNLNDDLDYHRRVYQDSSHSATKLATENRTLETRIKDLEHKASDNLLHIHEVNTQTELKMLSQLLETSNTQLLERNAELDRLREEMRLMKTGRRETRGTSVPRSPRTTGTLSPRGYTRSNGISASRGTSPTGPLQSIVETSSRWNHLRN